MNGPAGPGGSARRSDGPTLGGGPCGSARGPEDLRPAGQHPGGPGGRGPQRAAAQLATSIGGVIPATADPAVSPEADSECPRRRHSESQLRNDSEGSRRATRRARSSEGYATKRQLRALRLYLTLLFELRSRNCEGSLLGALRNYSECPRPIARRLGGLAARASGTFPGSRPGSQPVSLARAGPRASLGPANCKRFYSFSSSVSQFALAASPSPWPGLALDSAGQARAETARARRARWAGICTNCSHARRPAKRGGARAERGGHAGAGPRASVEAGWRGWP